MNTVASFAVRSCLSAIELSKTPYLSKPEIRIEGYKNWLANALIYFVYSINNLSKSYREKDLILTNKFFPLFIDEVKENIVDANILRDLDELGIQSGFSMVYNSSLHYASESALELHYFCRKKILESLQGDIRSKVGYKDSLVAWDAGWCQVRGIDGFFTAEDETRYSYLLSKARDDLMAGGYRFGMIN